MEKRFTQKSVREIEAGDCLAEDVLDSDGKVVLAKGTQLQPQHAAKLIDLHVFTVKVGTSSTQVAGRPLTRTADVGEFERMFLPHKDDPLMAALCKAAREHIETKERAKG
jgi:hypothetical protein